MARIPLHARNKSYSGSNTRKQREAIDHNAMAERVIEHLYRLLAQEPDGTHTYFWADIARELSMSHEDVESAVRYGSHHGIMIGINDEDRAFLARYK